MLIPVAVMTETVGTPEQIMAARLQDAPHLPQMRFHVLGMKVLDHRRADRPIKHTVGKFQMNGRHGLEFSLHDLFAQERP